MHFPHDLLDVHYWILHYYLFTAWSHNSLNPLKIFIIKRMTPFSGGWVKAIHSNIVSFSLCWGVLNMNFPHELLDALDWYFHYCLFIACSHCNSLNPLKIYTCITFSPWNRLNWLKIPSTCIWKFKYRPIIGRC